MNTKNMFLLTFSLIAVLVLAMNVSAVGVQVTELKINSDEVEDIANSDLNEVFERGEDLDLRVKVQALEDVSDVQVYAILTGYDYAGYEQEKVLDSTDTIDMNENDVDRFDLSLTIPEKMDIDYYNLRLFVADRAGTSETYEYSIHVKGIDDSDAIQIKRFDLSPSSTVYAGRAVTAKVKIKNFGDEDLDDVTVKVSVPELGIQDVETLDEIDSDETETFEELLLRIPTTAEPGQYTINVEVEFDEYESTMITETITVECYEGDEGCGTVTDKDEETSIINVPKSMDWTQSGVAFPITIENKGSADSVYSLAVSGINWGSYKFDPAADVIVPANSVKTVYLTIDAENLEAGEKYFQLEVNTGTETNEVSLAVNVDEDASSASLRNALEIGLIILVVILIIIGLIIGFGKLRDNNRDEEDAETYY
jgi:uncharacterized membrane protein